mmetsp:Transcript_48179/g.112726  ORF Transcript_48179/g.112726 Transcript_48179/m.112726 type:complete len:559 (+) Transcript_48179:252-1928(+)
MDGKGHGNKRGPGGPKAGRGYAGANNFQANASQAGNFFPSAGLEMPPPLGGLGIPPFYPPNPMLAVAGGAPLPATMTSDAFYAGFQPQYGSYMAPAAGAPMAMPLGMPTPGWYGQSGYPPQTYPGNGPDLVSRHGAKGTNSHADSKGGGKGSSNRSKHRQKHERSRGSGRQKGGRPGQGDDQRRRCGEAPMKPEDEDRRHFQEVCYSLLGYGDDAHEEVRWLNEAYHTLSPEDLELWTGFDRQRAITDMKKRVRANADFLAMLVLSDEDAEGYHALPPDHQVQERNAVKVRTVLRQFVRDWAVEGKAERDQQYGPLISALERYVPIAPGSTKRPKVVLPGSGLSRLPFEVARKGYSAQGNEFSYHMLQGSKWVLNETSETNSHTIYPFVLGLGHRRAGKDHLRGVKIPDVCPMQVLCPDGHAQGPQEFSMCAGEFVEVYDKQKGEWDAVLSCFFLDTAKNVFLYIRTIADMLRPGGLWANFGPLLFHYAEQPSLISIELSWEEVKPAVEKYFVIKEEEVRQAYYTTNDIGLFHTRYRCIYFAAIRNSVPAEGVSHEVF